MLELKNISYTVDDEHGRREILKDISFSVDSRTFLVITGPNGSGKSTLAKVIMGITAPTAGRILLDGRDITGLDVSGRAKLGIGFAFQQPVRFKGLVIRDLIEMAAGKALSLEEACTYLSEVGLCAVDYVNREINASLSGGELKRVEIAMLLARGSRVAIFDEPEAGIDLWSFQNLIRVFEEMRAKSHGSVIIISHQERILETADTILVLAGGRISGMGKRDDILPELLTPGDSCRFHSVHSSTGAL